MTYAINGTSGNDTINGTSNDDTIFAKAGNDVVNAGSGNDYVDAGSGNDTVNAGNGNDEVYGGDGNDVINGEAGNDELHGGSGNDTIDGGTGNDLLDGGDGDDVLKGNVGCDIILGGDGNDTINAGGGNDLIYGGQGTDTAIFAGSYASYNIVNLFGLLFINGQDGTDLALDVEFLKFDNGTYNVATHAFTPNQPPAPTLSISDASANEEAGTITFTVTLSAPATSNVTFNYSTANGSAGAGDYVGVANGTATILAGQTTATITIALTNDKIVEPGGETFLVNLSNPVGATIADGQATGTIIEQDQLINGTPGNDGTTAAPLSGGPGDDTINGLAGDDHLAGNGGDDTLNGDAGRDRLTGGAGNDTLNGGGDFDHAVYTDATEGITVDFGAGTVTGGASVGNDTLNGIEGLKGTAFGDTFNASTYSHTSPNGGGVGYTLPGGFGVQGSFNEFEGNGGADIITGNGNTRISYQSATAGVTVNLQTGNASGDLSVGSDVIVSGVTAVRGSNFNDLITGRNDNVNTENFEGWGGDDFIDGNGGFDRARYDQLAIAGPNGIIVNLAAGTVTGRDAAATAVFGSDTLRSIESVRASNADDILNAAGFTGPTVPPPGTPSVNNGGDQGNFNEFEGMAGNDQITGNGNTRIVHYSAQAGITVTVSGFTNPSNPAAGFNGSVSGDASIGTDSFTGVSQIRGSIFGDNFTGFNNGTNSFEQFEGWAGNDFIDGGLGIDRARYDGNDSANYGVPLTNGMFFDMDAGTASGLDTSATFIYGTDTLRGIESIRGTNAHDVYDATGFSDLSINAGGQFNFNEFEGGGGNDQITGNGNTRTSYQNAGGAVTVNLAAGNTLGSHSSVGNDSIGPGVNAVRGSNFGDALIGSNNPFGTIQFFEGLGGNDSIDGGGGLDIARYDNQGIARGAATIVDSLLGTVTVTTSTLGTDTISNTELLQFTDAYQLTSAGQNANLIPLGSSGLPIFGTSLGETITIGTNQANRLIDLDGGTDTIVLGQAGTPTYNVLNLQNVEFITSTGGIETVFLQNTANGMDIDLGAGFDTLNLANTGNVTTVHNVETLNAFGSANDTITFFKDTSVNQTINLGLGTNVLNLAGSDGTFSMTLFGGNDFTVNGQTTAVDENLNVLNTQAGTTFDLGAGTFDQLHLNNLAAPGVNVVKVVNIENVFGDLDEADQITVLGNSLASTTVTAGAGPDQITLSSGIEQVRFINTGDSSYDLPFGGQRDIVTGFNADQDKFMFDHIPGTNAANFNFLLVNFGGQDVILVDIDGGGAVNPMAPGGYSGYEMAIGVSGLTGTLGLDDFVVLV